MKHHIHYITYMLIISLFLVSCSKNESGPGGNSGNTPVKQNELNISVVNWVISENTTYYSFYPGLISSINPLNGTVSLFIETDGEYKLIANRQTIDFSGGSLWLSIVEKNLTVYYRPFSGGPPPLEVKIKLVVYE